MPQGSQQSLEGARRDSLIWEPREELCAHLARTTILPMSTQLQSQAPLQEGVGELGAQVSPSNRAAPTPAMLMPKERLRHFPVCGGVSAHYGLKQLGNVGFYC